MFMTITDDCVQLYMYRQTPINIVPVLVDWARKAGYLSQHSIVGCILGH